MPRQIRTTGVKTVRRAHDTTGISGVITPSQRPKTPRAPANPVEYHLYTPDGVNRGGTCPVCGNPRGYWFDNPLCDRCVQGLKGARSNE